MGGDTMRHLLVRSSSLLWLLSWSMTGWAQGTTYHFKGASFQLPTPTGFCAPDPKNDNDARLIKGKTTVMSNSGNRLMKLAASCNQLNQRDFPYDFVLYYYPVASEKESFSGTTQSMRKAVCDD